MIPKVTGNKLPFTTKLVYRTKKTEKFLIVNHAYHISLRTVKAIIGYKFINTRSSLISIVLQAYQNLYNNLIIR